VKSIYDSRETLGNAEQKFLVELYYKNFIRAGAQLSEADKTQLRSLNQEEAKLSTDFQNKLLAATKAGALVVDNVADLDGMSEGEIAAAADAAKSRGLTGKWVIPLQNTTQHPAQASLKKRAVRERLFNASIMRTSMATRAIRGRRSHGSRSYAPIRPSSSVRDLLRLRTRQSDVESAGVGAQAAHRHGARCNWKSTLGSGTDAGVDR
jgi:Zn-dependent oligopeptidase